MSDKSAKPVAVVTGANRGLGLETARQLAKRDIRVIITSRNAGKGEMALEKLQAEGLDVLLHPLDVASENSVAELGAFIHSRCGRLDILVNNAGVFLDSHGSEEVGSASVFTASLETLTATLKTNLYGPLLLAQELVPLMKQQHYGRIVNLSSAPASSSEFPRSAIRASRNDAACSAVCTSARTGTPRRSSSATSGRPVNPAAPITAMGFIASFTSLFPS